jgi:hypothetical protein
MKYRYLAPGEEIVRVARRHLSVLARPALGTLALLGGLAALGLLTDPDTTGDALDQICGAVAVLLLLRFLLRLRRWSSERLLVTDQRIVEASGLIAKRVSSWPYARIHDLDYRRSIPGRLLGYGSLTIETTAPDAPVKVLERVPDPDGFYRDVMEVIMGEPIPAMIEVEDEEGDPDWDDWFERIRDRLDDRAEIRERATIEPDEADTGPLPRVG